MWQTRMSGSARLSPWLLLAPACGLILGCSDNREAALSPLGPPDHGPTLAAISSPTSMFLHGSGGTANPPTLSLDGIAPSATTPKYKDSPSIKFASGNPWTAVGTWTGASSLTSGSLTALGDVQLWLGLRNSDDIGTNFDLRVEAYENGTLFATGESDCIPGVTRNPDLAKQVAVSFAPFSAVTFNGTSDVLSLKVLTRIGTTGAGAFCGGHSNAVGLRSYFDAASRLAGFDATVVVPPCNCWSTKASMPTARFSLGVAAIGGILYAVGGRTGGGLSSVATVEAYAPTTNTWTTKASMPTARGELGVAVVGGILYAVGGSLENNDYATALGTVEAYDPATNTWTTKASMPTPRAELGVVAINGILYAVGGRNGNLNPAILTTVEAYDPSTDTWTTKASTPADRENLGVAAINGILYAVGGCSVTCPSARVDAYDPTTDTWTTKSSMPTPRQNLGVAANNGTVYSVGGYDFGFVATVEAYDPTSDMWTTKSSLPNVNAGLGVVSINGILYGVGGADNDSPFHPLATVEAYQP
jgi:N-acetylneuraminic acid mutarotase